MIHAFFANILVKINPIRIFEIITFIIGSLHDVNDSGFRYALDSWNAYVHSKAPSMDLKIPMQLLVAKTDQQRLRQ